MNNTTFFIEDMHCLQQSISSMFSGEIVSKAHRKQVQVADHFQLRDDGERLSILWACFLLECESVIPTWRSHDW